MTLSNGRTYLAIPGPSVVPDRVLNAMHQASPNIYGGPLYDIVDTIMADLKTLARTKQKVAIYIGNGHATWEAALSNIFSRGDKALALASGTFGLGFAEAARGLGVDVDVLDFGRKSGPDIDVVAEALRADKHHKIKAVLAVHTDTATSIKADIAALRVCLNSCAHPALLVVDCIASLGCDAVEMDDWGMDVMISASQKGLMMPPGLGFVWFSENAARQQKTADLVTPYWNWAPRADSNEFFNKFGGTAPTQHLFGLRASLDIILQEGLEAVWARHQVLANSVWSALDQWSKVGEIRMNVAEPGLRSHAVTAVSIGAPDGTRLRNWVETKAGVTLGIGLGMGTDSDPDSHGFFRIAHMGHVNAHMTMGVLGTIQAGLTALDIPHGPGALDAAAAVIATA